MKLGWVIVLLLAVSCNEKLFTGNVDCNDCYIDKPDEADLIIEVTINNKYRSVPIVVYLDEVEDNRVIYSDTVFSTPHYVYVEVGRKYSVKAEYRSGSKTVYAVDGTHLRALTVTDACDQTCYVIENETLDARLKSDP